MGTNGVDEETRSIGCCPRAGNYFRTKNNETDVVDDWIIEMKKIIDEEDTTEDNKIILQKTIKKMEKLREELDKTYNCQILRSIKVLIDEISHKIGELSTIDNPKLKKFVRAKKLFLKHLSDLYKKAIIELECNIKSSTTITATSKITKTTKNLKQ